LHSDLPSFPTRRSSDLPALADPWKAGADVGLVRRLVLRETYVPIDAERRADGVGLQRHVEARKPIPEYRAQLFQRLLQELLVIGDRKSTRLNSSHLGIS